jgi:hypothetical protein
MPETAVDEDGGFVFGENYIGTDEHGFCLILQRAGRNFDSDVEAEAVAHFVQEAAHDFFRGRVLALYPAHIP